MQKVYNKDLANKTGSVHTVIGRYERNEVFPSIEIARKIAEILDVSLDYLTGKVDVQTDKNTRKRILEVSKFEEQDREHIFSVIDAFIAKSKIQAILK
ncbi:MAG: helix-turn-helix transcriptional regulator [Flavobacteriaceae bacterium]|nr:helix-turn-helix transcriptional regulator [Flavobacteriaceae bacterium]